MITRKLPEKNNIPYKPLINQGIKEIVGTHYRHHC